MVHLFSIQRNGKRFSILARRIDSGAVVVESINGLEAHRYPTFITAQALRRVVPRSFDLPELKSKVDVSIAENVPDKFKYYGW